MSAVVLVCRYFWFSWNGNHINVGHGSTVGAANSIFLSYTDAVNFADMHTLQLSTGYGSTGRWEFLTDSG